MKKLFFVLFALLTGSCAFGQCLCGHIRFAIDDKFQYTYSYYEIGKPDTSVEEFLSASDQLHKTKGASKGTLHSHESYGVRDPKTDSIVTILHDDRKYAYFHIDQFSDFAIEVRHPKKKGKMILNFSKSGYDINYNILTGFEPGIYQIDLSSLWLYFYDNYEKEPKTYQGSVLKSIKSNFRENKYRDWIRIESIKKFWIAKQ